LRQRAGGFRVTVAELKTVGKINMTSDDHVNLLDELKEEAEDTGRKLRSGLGTFMRDIAHLALFAIGFAVVDAGFEHFISGNLMRPGLDQEVTDALSSLQPLDLLYAFARPEKLDVTQTPQYSACLSEQQRTMPARCYVPSLETEVDPKC
jgi:hypothetical protein